MSYQNTFERYEMKYILTKDQKEALYNVMEEHMEPDKFFKSTIRNIYYDTPDRLLIRKSIDKPRYKEKLRVRSYGPVNDETKVFIEIKKKYKGIVYKRRMELDQKTATNYLIKDVPLSKPSQISKEIDYLKYCYGDIRPSLFLSYNREAFSSKTDTTFRMTFDDTVITRHYDLCLSSGVYGEEDLLDGKMILEVKTVLGIPRWLVDFFNDNKIYKASYSKYGNAYLNLMLPRYLENRTSTFDEDLRKIV